MCVQLGLSELCHPTQGNFLTMPFEKEVFDAAYAIEATCHADKVHAASRYCLECYPLCLPPLHAMPEPYEI